MDEILTDIQNHLKTYMVFPDDNQTLAVALWTLHTHTFSDSFPRKPWTTPYLYVHSAQKQSGKTLLIDLLESLVLNPVRTVDMSSAVLFRLIEEMQPALFIDEADAIWSGAKNESLRGLLNGGYKHGGTVYRAGADGGVLSFRTFSPKLLAGIDNEQLPDTIMDRCIPIKLARKPKDATVKIYYEFQAGPDAEILANRIVEWVRDNAMHICEYLPEPLEGVSPRAFEIAMPLLQIAHAAQCEKEAREALAALLTPRKERDSPEVAVLRAIRDMFDAANADKIHTQTICDALNINGKRLAGILRPFGITGNNTMAIGGRTLKGYWRQSFEEAWDTYL